MDPYAIYRKAHGEIRELISTLDETPDGTAKRLAFRGVAVLICAEFEAYMRELVQARMDAISAPWDGMLAPEKKIVAGHALEALTELAERLNPNGVEDLADAKGVAKLVRRLAKWLEEPGGFAREIREVKLRYFYDPTNASVAVNKFLLQLRPDGLSLFAYMHSKGIDPSPYGASLEAVVGLRGDVAHQLRQDMKPTAAELRLHQSRLAVLARVIRTYVS